MVWWLFKTKKDEETGLLHKNLRISFSNIKKDIDSLGSWIRLLDSRDKNIIEEIKLIKQELLIINQNIRTLNIKPKEESEENYEKELKVEINQFDSNLLTETQEIIIVKLLKIQREEGTENIPLKYLAKECYDRDYSQVRSTLSEYTGYLEELNLVQRKKKGKQVFISITEKGIELAKKLSQEKGFLFVKKQAVNHRKS
jgi:predicted transcriptional regulator